MKVFISSMSAELGGIEKSLIEILKYLISMGADVDLLLWKQRGPLLDEIPQEVNLISSPAPGNISAVIKKKNIKNLLFYFRFKKNQKRGCAWRSFPLIDRQYDVAIAYSQDGYSPFYVIDNIKAPKKYMWYHHGDYNRMGSDRKLDLLYYMKFTNIITVSHANKEMLELKLPELKGHIKVIPNLIDEKKIQVLAKEPCKELDGYQGIKIVTVGRISPEKNQMEAVRIALELKQKGYDFRWVFVGDGHLSDENECQRLIQSLDLQNECLMVGSKKNPYPYMRAADLYVQPSRVESEAITLKEAALLNKNIIATDLPAIVETLTCYSQGYICKIEDMGNAVLRFVAQNNNNISTNKIELRNCYMNETKRRIYELLMEGY